MFKVFDWHRWRTNSLIELDLRFIDLFYSVFICFLVVFGMGVDLF